MRYIRIAGFSFFMPTLPTSFARWSPVKIQQDVSESCELVYRLFLLGADSAVVVAVVVVVAQTPDDKVTVTVT